MLEMMNRKLTMTIEQAFHVQQQYDLGEPMQHMQQIVNGCFGRKKGIGMSKLKRRRQQDSGEVDVNSPTEKPSRQLRTSKRSGTLPFVLNSNRTAAMDDTRDAGERAKITLSESLKTVSDATYRETRSHLLRDEEAESWDAKARKSASEEEIAAQKIIFKIREHERDDPTLFGNLPSEAVPSSESRDLGGRFLVNKERIERSLVFNIARRAPKGTHLHLHFNSELKPEVLFPHARRLKDTMFVRTTRPLHEKSSFGPAEIVFQVLPKDTPSVNIFSSSYNPDWKDKSNNAWMRWADFRATFPTGIDTEERCPDLDNAECWAREKMVLTNEIAYNDRQTHNGTWACFNQGTRAFKGLVNYESVYRWYIGAAIDNMIFERVMYAELRPMLMDKTIPSDDGLRQLDHKAQMNIIIEEVKRKQNELKARGELDKFPFGLRIIYSVPRSIPRQRMALELEDCIKLKLQFPDLICGFDLVGAEDRPNCIGFYADQLLAFTDSCKRLGISIPFMFHAGETLLDTGGSHLPDNSNLYDSLLLNAKRIGHGYALLKHPMLIRKFKEQNIALELCPISNELLHLCGNAREHPFPALLAAGLHCSLNADNPSLFRGAGSNSSTLSHEFYQVMVGDTRMTIHGWRQLAEWSIEHSCMTPDEQKEALAIFGREWQDYCEWIIANYSEHANGLDDFL